MREEKTINDEEMKEPKSIDQSTLQFYMILGMQDFYQNYHLPMKDEIISLREELDKTQSMLMNYKKKNDERFDIIMKHLEVITERINIKKYK